MRSFVASLVAVAVFVAGVPPIQVSALDEASAVSCLTPDTSELYAVTDEGGLLEIVDADSDLVDPDSDDCKLTDFVTWSAVFPASIRSGDSYQVIGFVTNGLAVPLAVDLEYYVSDTNICSVTGFSTDAGLAATETVILAPEGNELEYQATLFKDRATFGLSVIASAVGTCEIGIVALAGTLDTGVAIALGTHEGRTPVKLPLTNKVDLGVITANCALSRFEPIDLPESLDVAAGTVDFTIRTSVSDGNTEDSCRQWSWVIVTAELVNSENEADSTAIVTAKSRGRAGSASAETQNASLAVGDHVVRLRAVYLDTSWLTLSCMGTLIAAGVGVLLSSVVVATATLVIAFVLIALEAACADSIAFTWSQDVDVAAFQEGLIQ